MVVAKMINKLHHLIRQNSSEKPLHVYVKAPQQNQVHELFSCCHL